MNNYIVFDCETGGLDPEKNPITEIALIAFQGEDFKEIGRYETFIQPYGTDPVYEPKALEMTGITMDMINSGKEHKQFIKELITWFKSVKRRGRNLPVMIAHNAIFDQGMLDFAFHTANKNLYEFVDPIFIDTLHLSRLKDADKSKHNLKAACERFGIEIVNAHRAMDDVEATKQFIVQYFSSVRHANASLFEDASDITVPTYREQFKFG